MQRIEALGDVLVMIDLAVDQGPTRKRTLPSKLLGGTAA